MFLGYPDLIRGYTSGSYTRHECNVAQVDNPNSATGCAALDQLVGTSIAVANAEAPGARHHARTGDLAGDRPTA